MRKGATIAVVIPALNEEQAIGHVLAAIPGWVDDVVVADNGSTDQTASVASQCGARVVTEPCRGYGAACLAGIAALRRPDVVVFLDADFSDDPTQMNELVDPVIAGGSELVIGSRTLGLAEQGSLTLVQRFGNRLACGLIRYFWGVRHTDLGPFRAIRFLALQRLRMTDRSFGWTVEMQVKAARRGLCVSEVPVRYRGRIGRSKISGTVGGVVRAGTKILATIGIAAVDTIFELLHLVPPRNRLIVFTRSVEPGRVKTRMIRALGPEGAAKLHGEMVGHTMRAVRCLSAAGAIRAEVRYTGGGEEDFRTWLGNGLMYTDQGGGDLGERLVRGFEDAFGQDADRVVIIGTDCPDLSSQLIRDAFDRLADSDVVLGPAADGGYYLVGLRLMEKRLLSGIPWGTEFVLAATLGGARCSGLSVSLLPELADVDRPGDLPVWGRVSESAGRISVVIPTLNEFANIRSTLSALVDARNIEIIVVDGGSVDGTADLAREAGALVLTTGACRARQMNLGAAAATGGILLFLHADTILPPGFGEEIRRILAMRGVAAGAFRLRIGAPQRGLRMIEWGANLRSCIGGMPYGDQAIFVRAEDFRDIGGYPDVPIMEDVELIRKMAGRGRIEIACARAMTSPRRWVEHGTVRTTLLNQLLVLGHFCGASPVWLRRWR